MSVINVGPTPVDVNISSNIRIYNSGVNIAIYKYNAEGLEYELQPGNFVDIPRAQWLDRIIFYTNKEPTELVVMEVI